MRGIPASRTPRRPRQKRDEWCSRERQRVPGSGGQRCPRCGRRLQAYPEFDDGLGLGDVWGDGHPRGLDLKRMPPGTGRETIAREGKSAADSWYIGPHKVSKAKR